MLFIYLAVSHNEGIFIQIEEERVCYSLHFSLASEC